MTFYFISGIANIVFGVLLLVYLRKIMKLEKKLRYTEACLEREEGNNRRMLKAIDDQIHNR